MIFLYTDFTENTEMDFFLQATLRVAFKITENHVVLVLPCTKTYES